MDPVEDGAGQLEPPPLSHPAHSSREHPQTQGPGLCLAARRLRGLCGRWWLLERLALGLLADLSLSLLVGLALMLKVGLIQGLLVDLALMLLVDLALMLLVSLALMLMVDLAQGLLVDLPKGLLVELALWLLVDLLLALPDHLSGLVGLGQLLDPAALGGGVGRHRSLVWVGLCPQSLV